eukprot:maker-scaffold_7-snap-gene-3.63-mRNA-1 protein AED:0.00 eAED:0.00 QI:102/1/1/1/0.5/0.33/3/251/560
MKYYTIGGIILVIFFLGFQTLLFFQSETIKELEKQLLEQETSVQVKETEDENEEKKKRLGLGGKNNPLNGEKESAPQVYTNSVSPESSWFKSSPVNEGKLNILEETINLYRLLTQEVRRSVRVDYIDEAMTYAINRASTPVIDFDMPHSSSIKCFSSSAAHMRYRLGKDAGKLSGDTICYFSKLCIQDRSFSVLASEEDTRLEKEYPFARDKEITKEYYDFPPSLISKRKVKSMLFSSNKELDSYWQSNKRVGNVVSEPTWLVTHSYVRHVTHFSEHVTPIFHAMSRVDIGKEGLKWPETIHLLDHGNNMFEWQTELLKSIPGMKNIKTREMRAERKCYENAFVPGYIFHLFQDVEEGRFLQQSVFNHISYIPPGQLPKKIFFAHRTSKRKITNFEETEALISKLVKEHVSGDVEVATGFQSKMSFAKQVQIAAESQLFISIHGADLTNIMFMKPGSVVIEICPKNWQDSRFVLISESLKLIYMQYFIADDDIPYAEHAGENYKKYTGFKKRSVRRESSVQVNWNHFQNVLMDALFALGWLEQMNYPIYSPFRTSDISER